MCLLTRLDSRCIGLVFNDCSFSGHAVNIAYNVSNASSVSTASSLIAIAVTELVVITQLAKLSPMPEDDKIISLRIFMPESLRNSFKAVCAKQGRNMSEVVTDFVRNYIDEFEKSSVKH